MKNNPRNIFVIYIRDSFEQCNIAMLWTHSIIVRSILLTHAQYTLASVCIFSMLFSIYFVRCWQGDVLWQTRASLVFNPFLYCRYLNVRFRGDTVEIICESLLRGKGSTQMNGCSWINISLSNKLYRFNVQDSTTTSPIGAITKKKFSHF